MKFYSWIIGLVLLCSTQMTFAYEGDSCSPCHPCAPCDLCDIEICDMEMNFYADYLYWKLCRGELDYLGEDGDVHYLNPHYDSGFRVGLISSYKCWDFGLRYTYFFSDKSVEGPIVEDEHTRFRFKFDYDVLDIEAGYVCCLNCINGYFRPFAGARCAWIEDKFQRDHSDLEFKGYGLYLGGETKVFLCEWCMCERVVPTHFVARASTGILDGRFRQRSTNEEGTHKKKQCMYVPFHELFVGLDFGFCDFYCMDAYVQVGYETQEWLYRAADSRHRLSNFGLGGLTVRFGANF